VSATSTLLRLHDLDLLLQELGTPESLARLKRMGYALGPVEPLSTARDRLLATLDRRWLTHYERAHRRYGKGLAAVRGRACQGCFMTLATSAAPAAGEALTLCESCGRVLFWP
jgi:hypothetical protein